MALSDKSRKILWARSGARCAMCKAPIVVDRTEADREAIVGDECHIISGAEGGPRADSNFPRESIDSLENLMLLCRVHHKLVDDQASTFTTTILRVHTRSGYTTLSASSRETFQESSPCGFGDLRVRFLPNILWLLRGKR